MNADQIMALDAQARQGWTYLADPVNDDNWRSHADDVLAGRPWQGDCDDLASTVLDLAGRQGVPLASRYRLEVVSPGGVPPCDHMIAAMVDDAGQFYTVGDTFGVAAPASACPHTAYRYQRMDDWDSAGQPVFRAGFPWAPA